jgi:hypothetical protein
MPIMAMAENLLLIAVGSVARVVGLALRKRNGADIVPTADRIMKIIKCVAGYLLYIRKEFEANVSSALANATAPKIAPSRDRSIVHSLYTYKRRLVKVYDDFISCSDYCSVVFDLLLYYITII